MDFYKFENEKERDLYQMLFDYPEMVLYLKNKHQTDRVLKFCIEQDPSIFGKLTDPSVDIAEYALDVDGENIIPLIMKFDNIPLTKKMCYIALRSYPGAIGYIPKSMLTEEMLDMAFNAQPSLLSVFEKLPEGYLLTRIKNRPSDIRYVTNPSDALIYAALESDPNLCVYFRKLTPQMINLLCDINPKIAEMYINSLESETMKDAKSEETKRPEEVQWSNSY